MSADGDGIRCPICGADTHVAETRQNRGSLRRRRRCITMGCEGRITTVEIVAPRYSKRHATCAMVAVPSVDASELAVVPRKLIAALRKLLREVEVDALDIEDEVTL